MNIVIFFNGFWSGFEEETNAVHKKFFLQLFQQVYNTPNVTSGSYESANVLLENTQVSNSRKHDKAWLHTYLFSGESYIRNDLHEYSCVLYGSRNYKNVVNCPLYIPYLYSSYQDRIASLFENKGGQRTDIPKRDCVVFISNPGGHIRNTFLDRLEKHMNVTYAGNYRNNIGGAIQDGYHTKGFHDYISQFQFVITMENSSLDTYITEKVFHGLFAETIPVYWGATQIHDYINSERIITVQNEGEIDSVIQRMKHMSDSEWIGMVQKPFFTEFGQNYSLDTIAKQIQNIVFSPTFPLITQVYGIASDVFEPARFRHLQVFFQNQGFRPENITYMCKTYKHTITDAMYQKYVKYDIVRRLRPHIGTRKSELSLTLNFRYIFEDIVKRYKDGAFLLFESDVIAHNITRELNECFQALEGKEWDCISLGSSTERDLYDYNAILGPTPYRDFPSMETRNRWDSHAIEDITGSTEKIRFIRKYHTRCTDSLLFSYKGVCKILEHLMKDENYGVPFDYYFTDFTENNLDFRFYWSNISYFNQMSNMGLDASTIQHDTW